MIYPVNYLPTFLQFATARASRSDAHDPSLPFVSCLMSTFCIRPPVCLPWHVLTERKGRSYHLTCCYYPISPHRADRTILPVTITQYHHTGQIVPPYLLLLPNITTQGRSYHLTCCYYPISPHGTDRTILPVAITQYHHTGQIVPSYLLLLPNITTQDRSYHLTCYYYPISPHTCVAPSGILP